MFGRMCRLYRLARAMVARLVGRKGLSGFVGFRGFWAAAAFPNSVVSGRASCHLCLHRFLDRDELASKGRALRPVHACRAPRAATLAAGAVPYSGRAALRRVSSMLSASMSYWRAISKSPSRVDPPITVSASRRRRSASLR
jgi:hypothetical protein